MPVIIQSQASNATTGVAATSLVINKPAGTVEGDLLIATMAVSNATTPPAGWTVGPTNGAVRTFWKIAGPSEPASYTFTAGLSNWFATIARITGHSPSDPIAASAATPWVADPTVTLPSVNAPVDGGLIQMVVANESSGALTWTPPAGVTEVYDIGGPPLIAAGGHDTAATPGGETGTRAWVCSGNRTTGGGIFAVNPAVAVSSSPGKIRIVYHATNTFTMPTGIPGDQVKVQCEGPGGPGGNGNSTNRGGGGGGGAFAEEPALVLTPGNTYDVIPGLADAPGGAAPVASTFGPVGSPLVRAAAGGPGGNASGISNGTAGAGGTVAGSIGTTKTAGTSGVAGGSGGAGASPLGGAGGTSGASINGSDYGGGGGGGAILSGVGGTSGRGVVILEFQYVSDAALAADFVTLVVNFNRTMNESVAASDEIAKLVLKSPNEVVTASDSIVKRDTLSRSDSVTISDSLVKRLTFPRTESVAALDAMTKRLSLPRGDSVTVSDAIVKRIILNRSEVVTTSDTIVKVVRFLRSETVVTTDTINKVLRMLKVDGVTASDAFVKIYRKNQAETVVTSDTIARILRKPVAENVTVTDSVLVVLVALRYFNETATAVDAVSKRFTLTKADSVTVLESAFRRFVKNITGDAAVASDAVFIQGIYRRAYADSVVTVDAISKTIRLGFSDNISGEAPPPTGTGRRLFAIMAD